MTSPATPVDICKFQEFEKLKGCGSNYLAWYNNFTGVLDTMGLLYVIQEPLGEAPALNASQDEIDAHWARIICYANVKYGINLSIEP